MDHSTNRRSVVVPIDQPRRPRLPAEVRRRLVVYSFTTPDGAALYAGCSKDVVSRLNNHSWRSEWWPLAGFLEVVTASTVEEMVRIERRAIDLLQPPFNLAGVTRPHAGYGVRS